MLTLAIFLATRCYIGRERQHLLFDYSVCVLEKVFHHDLCMLHTVFFRSWCCSWVHHLAGGWMPKTRKKSFWFQSIIPHLGIDGVTNNDIEYKLHAMPWLGMVLVNH